MKNIPMNRCSPSTWNSGTCREIRLTLPNTWPKSGSGNTSARGRWESLPLGGKILRIKRRSMRSTLLMNTRVDIKMRIDHERRIGKVSGNAAGDRHDQRGGFCHKDGTDVCGPIKNAVIKRLRSDRKNEPTLAKRNNSRLEDKT